MSDTDVHDAPQDASQGQLLKNNQEETQNVSQKNYELQDLTLNHINKGETIKNPTWKDIWPQVMFGSISMLSALQAGVHVGFSAVFLPQLVNDPNLKEFKKSEASWTASLVTLSGPIGGLAVGPLMDSIGRRKACIISNVPHIICWILTYSVSQSIWPLYVARIIAGCGAGMIGAVNVYVSEISHAHYRGMMLCSLSVFVSLGILMTMVIGVCLEWHTASLWFGLLALISFGGSFILPESPCWLIHFNPSKERLNEAFLQIARLNTSDWLCQQESNNTYETYLKCREFNSTSSIRTSGGNVCHKFRRRFKIFKERTVYTPLIILVMLFLFQELSGIFVILFYSTNIFQAIGSNFGGGINEYTATVMVGLIRFLMTLITTYLSLKIGRRPLMLASNIGMTLCMLLAAVLQTSSANQTLEFVKTASTMQAQNQNRDSIKNLVTVIALLTFVLSATIGQLNIPWALLTELLPTRARALGNGLIISFVYIAMFTVVKGVPFLLDIITLATMFYSFAALSLVSTLYVYFRLPETFRKDFADIERAFKEKKLLL